MRTRKRKRFLEEREIRIPLVEKLGFERIDSAAATGWGAGRFSGAAANPYFFCLLKGRITWRSSGAEALIQRGGTLFVCPGGKRLVAADNGRLPPGSVFWLRLRPPDRLRKRDFSVLPRGIVNKLYKRLLSGDSMVIGLNKEALRLIERLEGLVSYFPGEDRAVAGMELILLTSELMLEFMRMSDAPAAETANRVIAEGIKYVEEHATEKIRMSDLEGFLGYSSTWIQKSFRQVTGMAPHQYQLRYRIDRARELLLSDGKSVTGVALECGFSSGQHFSSVFKKITGLTPTRYLEERRR